MVKDQTRITTNIDSKLLKFIDNIAREREVTRREIIEESMKRLELEIRGRAITEAYNRMSEDKELMDEWLAIANDPENLKFYD